MAVFYFVLLALAAGLDCLIFGGSANFERSPHRFNGLGNYTMFSGETVSGDPSSQILPRDSPALRPGAFKVNMIAFSS
jgi:hypothetical protein